MGVLQDDKKPKKDDNSAADEKTTAKAGYATPLFEHEKARWNDDRMFVSDSIDSRYHDRDRCLKIVSGLCSDIFFRAEQIESEEFKSIPDFSDPVEEEAPKKPVRKSTKPTKPLDSKNKNRTYILSTEIEEEKPTRKRRPSKPRSRRRPRRGPAKARGPKKA